MRELKSANPVKPAQESSFFHESLSPFTAPNSRSPPKFRHSLSFTLLPKYTRATLHHGRPCPGPNHEAAPSSTRCTRRRPLLTTHDSLPSLCPRHLHHVASISLPFSAVCAYFPSPRGYTIHHSRRQTFRPPGMPSLLFASACCLFVVSLHSFRHSLPLFSIGCGLFSKNTGGGGCVRRFL